MNQETIQLIGYLLGGGAVIAIITALFFFIKNSGKSELKTDILEVVAKNNQEALKRSKQDAKKLSDTSYDDLVDKL